MYFEVLNFSIFEEELKTIKWITFTINQVLDVEDYCKNLALRTDTNFCHCMQSLCLMKGPMKTHLSFCLIRFFLLWLGISSRTNLSFNFLGPYVSKCWVFTLNTLMFSIIKLSSANWKV